MAFSIQDFIRLGAFEWELPVSFRKGMRAKIVFFSDEDMISASLQDRSVEQAVNAAFLPGVVAPICVMPDIHQGYGFPIGGVAATSAEDGVISPSAVGYDINCGVRLLSSRIPAAAISDHLYSLIEKINIMCPSGVGKNGRIDTSLRDMEDVCISGIQWTQKRGFLNHGEEASIEDFGCMAVDSISDCSSRAIERGRRQLGSLGAGNHFIEIDRVDQVFDAEAAQVFGLVKGSLAVQIHTGSRGFGHQICTDYVHQYHSQLSESALQVNNELVYARLDSKLGQSYFNAMKCAANYAFVNRQILAYSVREAVADVFGKLTENVHLETVYDLAHNIAKIERIQVSGETMELCVHRKGATRSLGSGDKRLPKKYLQQGQPVLVPGSMGTSSWVLKGLSTADRSMNSCCHGAGRVLSRSQARRNFQGQQIINQLNEKGIVVQAGSLKGLAEEAPQVYKDVDQVISCIEGAGLASRVARLTPLAILKG